MICSACGHENREGASFCDQCGARLQKVCPNCSAVLRPEARFCDACGHRLDAPVAQPATSVSEGAAAAPLSYTPRHLAERILRDRSGIEGERRAVTVLFIDAADSTATGSRLDPEVLMGVVREYTERMVEAVHKYEGTVTQFRGDGIMAIFGAPIAQEDSARRAVAAAVQMRDELIAFAEELRQAGRPSFRYRIGLNSGPVIVGRIGDDLSMDYTAIGDTVNLAARMEQWAPPGSIYITGTTYRQVSPYFECEPQGQLEIKGKSETVEGYRVLHARTLDGAGADDSSPFVGRDEEVSSLQGYYDQARRGRGQVVFLSGEAGMGKSRLIREFRRVVSGEDVTWIEGHCSAYGQNTPYLPIVELLRRNFKIDESDREPEIIARVDEGVSGWELAARRTAPILRLLLNVDPGDESVAAMEPSQRRAAVLDGLRAFLLQSSRQRPLILVIEDLHWIDEQSEEAIRALIDVVPSVPALLLLAFRPGYNQPFGDRSYFSRLSLRSLDADDSTRISEAVLQGVTLPPELRDLVLRRAEGNPFYVEEITRSLSESGVLRRRNGSLVLTRSLDELEIPDTIQGVILSRIDRLDRNSREALQLASVIGREFTVRLLERISSMQIEVEGLLGQLKALELIYEKAYFPEVAYMFKHALTHDVAYATLLSQRRRALHRIVGLAIEELYAERLSDHYEMLAHHFYEAQDWDKAHDYLVSAGRRAVNAYANKDAITYLDKALQALDASSHPEEERTPVRAEIHAQRGKALAQAGLWVDAKPELVAALQGIGRDQPIRRMEVLADACFVSFWARDTASLKAYALELTAIGQEHKREDYVTIAEGWIASSKSADGDPIASLEGIREVTARAKKLNITLPSGPASHFIMWTYWTGNLEESVEAGRTTLARARHEKDIRLLAEALPHLGMSLGASGRYAEASETFREAREHCKQYGVFGQLARAVAMEGGFRMDLLDFAAAEALHQEAAELARTYSFPPALVSSGIDLLLNCARRNQPEDAEKLAGEIEAAVEKEAGWHGWLWKLRLSQAKAELALARGEAEEALRWTAEAIERGTATGRVKYRVAALSTRGRALHLLGRDREAIGSLREAVERARPVGDPGMLVRAASALLALDGDDELLAEARTTAERIAAALPDEATRTRFLDAEHVRLILAG